MIVRAHSPCPEELRQAVLCAAGALVPLFAGHGARPAIRNLAARCGQEATVVVPHFVRDLHQDVTPSRLRATTPSSPGVALERSWTESCEAADHAAIISATLAPVLRPDQGRIHLYIRSDLVCFSTDWDTIWRSAPIGPLPDAAARTALLALEAPILQPGPGIEQIAAVLDEDHAHIVWVHPHALATLSSHEQLEFRSALAPLGEDETAALARAATQMGLEPNECLRLRRQDATALLVISSLDGADDFGVLWATRLSLDEELHLLPDGPSGPTP